MHKNLKREEKLVVGGGDGVGVGEIYTWFCSYVLNGPWVGCIQNGAQIFTKKYKSSVWNKKVIDWSREDIFCQESYFFNF